jgi:peptidoglycan/xylan/chitin deacetylase (PgdA/CDA1 family)
MIRLVLLYAGLTLSASLLQAGREVAITMDDLPSAQAGDHGCEWASLESLTRRLLEPIRSQKVPVTAFVIARHCLDLPIEQRRAIFNMWTSAGVELGNHSYSHPDLNSTPIADYEKDILGADAILRETTGAPLLDRQVQAMARNHEGRDRHFLAPYRLQQAPRQRLERRPLAAVIAGLRRRQVVHGDRHLPPRLQQRGGERQSCTDKNESDHRPAITARNGPSM